MSSRRRKTRDDEDEPEKVNPSTEEDEEEEDDEDDRDRRRSRKDRRSRKKKDKKKKKHRKRKRSRSRSNSSSRPSKKGVLDHDDVTTDDDVGRRGSTPEVVEDDDDDDVEDNDKRSDVDIKDKPVEVMEVDQIEDGEIEALPPHPQGGDDDDDDDKINDDKKKKKKNKKKMESEGDVTFAASSSDSLSVEETNKLRAKLGLAPLNTSNNNSKDDSNKSVQEESSNHEFAEFELIPSSTKGERHKPAENLSALSRTEKIRQKLKEKREKRIAESKLLKVKSLGEVSDSDDEASSWVKKQEQIQKAKEEAAKRAKMLEELDEEFGVSNLVEEDAAKDRSQQYGRTDLKGLKVQHSAENFVEGKDVILTLKDADVLDESGKDTLVNVNMLDDETAKKNVENVKKAKDGHDGYNPYDQEFVDDVTGEVKKRKLLEKYDDYEVEGMEIKGEEKGFSIGKGGMYNEEEEKRKQKEQIRAKLNATRGQLISLELPEKKIASDYYNPGEIVTFKKKKAKVKKVKRRMLKADDLINLVNKDEKRGEGTFTSFGSRKKKVDEDENQLDEDVGEIQNLSEDVVLREEREQESAELTQAQKLKQKIREKLSKNSSVKIDVADRILEEERTREPEETYATSGAELIGTFADDEINSKNIILNETSEFCRNLGAWRSSQSESTAGYKEKKKSTSVLDEFEDSLKSSSTKRYEERKWKEMEEEEDDDDVIAEDDVIIEEGVIKKKVEPVTILDEEPNLAYGVGSAIKMAMNKGYWDTDVKKTQSSNLKHLMSQNYMIDDKVRSSDGDDRGSRRQHDRYGGPTVPFQEKKEYIPNVKLDYIDDNGRKLNAKEAFRHLSHKFHGKGSGKLKTEKRMKKVMEESMMRNMSSTDTPLGTVEKMIKKQKETSTPYLVISGKNQHPDLRK